MVFLPSAAAGPRPSLAVCYATRAMIHIAQADGLVSAAAIAQRQQVPPALLDQLLGRLRRAGLLTSVRGPRGGYLLARSASSITFAAIVSAVEFGPHWIQAADASSPIA